MQDPLAEPIGEGRIATIHPWPEGRVLKLAREWVSPDALTYEYRIAKIVFAAGLDVPEPVDLMQYNGRTGILYTRVDGPTMLGRIGTAPHKARSFGRTLGILHARIHACTGDPALPDAADSLRAAINRVPDLPGDLRREALDRLGTLPAGDRLLHFDFHPDNIILSPNGPVVIDWPNAVRGHPMADVARTVLLTHVGGVPRQVILRLLIGMLRKVFRQAYLAAYFKHAPYQKKDFEAWVLPVATARLEENIQEERAALIQLIEHYRGAS